MRSFCRASSKPIRFATNIAQTTMLDVVVGVHKHSVLRRNGEDYRNNGMLMRKRDLERLQVVEETGRRKSRNSNRV